MNGRQWKPGGGTAGSASTSNDRGLAPGKRTLVEGLNYGPPQPKAGSAPLQTKVAVGSPGDSHEQEADRVAEQVMSPGPVRQPIGQISPRIQQQADDHAEATVVAAVASSASGDANGGIALSGAAGAAADVRDEGTAAHGEATGTPGVMKHAQFGPHGELVVMAKEVAGQTPRDRGGLADQLTSTRGGGEAMPEGERSFFESRFGENFGDVQIHAGSDAAGMNAQLGSRAFTHQRDVYFGAGEYQPGSPDGRRLLAHELTHVVQQTRGGAQGNVQRQEKDKDKGSPRPVGYTIRVPAKEVGKAQEFLVTTLAQAFGVSPARASTLIAKEGWHWQGGWAGPSDADVKVGYVDVVFEIAQYRQTQDKLKPAGDRDAGGRLQGAGAREAAMQRLPVGEQVPLNQEANRRFWARTGYKVGLPLGDSPEDRKQAKLWFEIRDEMLAERDKLAALPPEIKSVLGGDGAILPKDYERALEVAGKLAKLDPKDRAMYQLHGLTDGLDELDRKLDQAAGKPGEATESPAEMSRLLQVFKTRVKDPQFSDSNGQSWLKFAKFLDQNKNKIEGILQGNPPGHLTQAKIDQIIGEYGKFIAAEPAGNEEPAKLETQDDFDKKFKYDPGWQKLSKEDRRLLIDYAKLSPNDVADGKVDFARVTTDMKVSMALKLSWQSWPGEVADAAKSAFSDPGFLISLVLIIAVYVGLWLTPEPTMVTKVAAGVLTVVLLAQFAWEDIYGLAKAWMALQDDCRGANSVTALQAAGDKFAKKVGQVGFDILMAIAMWGLGKAAGPKVAKLGAQRATARATAEVGAAEAKPGSGVPVRATGEALKVMDQATTRAQGTGKTAPTEAAVLDALGELLTEGGKPEAAKGLKDFRAKLGDANTKRALDSELGKGNDLASFLTEKGMTPQAKAAVRAEVEAARVKLARAKLIELKINEDPHLRARIKVDLAELAKQLTDGKIAATDEAGFQRTVQGYNITELVGEIGEALARESLRSGAAPGQVVLSNMEIVREVPGYKTISAWKAAEQAAGRPGDVGGLYEAGGKLWKSITEVDNVVVEQGAGGKLRVVDLEQTKVGGTHAAAAAQNTKAMAGLGEIAAGKTDVQIFDRVGKNKLGAQRTGEFDLSNLTSTGQHTRGLPGTGFDRKLPFDKITLEDLARQLLMEGLPDVWHPPSAVPPTGDRNHDRGEQK